MSYVLAVPEMMGSAATELATIGSRLGEANAAAATSTSTVLAAASDEVSAAIADLFSAHGREFQAMSAQAAAFQSRVIVALSSSAESFISAEAVNLSALGNSLWTSIFGSSAIEPVPAGQNPAFSGTQDLLTRIETAALRPVKTFLTLTGIYDQLGTLGSPVQQLFVSGLLNPLFSDAPPRLLTALLGETVRYTTYEGMSVVEIVPANPTGNYVVALHGGAFVWPPMIFHWLGYSVMAYQTGATFAVPIYPLIQQGGTAGTVVPKVAGYISTQIAAHGVSHVSVLGDSAGATIGLSAVQYLVAHNQAVPRSMVLLSPLLDQRLVNPNIGLIDDPFFPDRSNRIYQANQLWAGDLALTDPLVSPLFGSLAGLPPTYVYAGSLDPVAPDQFILAQNAVLQSAPINFVLATGGFHDWILLSPGGLRYWPQIERELGL
ncbi:PE domain-containing protein [Mycobacterium sp. TY814]|uniref:triacylglycerol lipase LipY n=1 Tax=unclassified Mycobacterium TaxID=2642494 RepID=UPI0027419718|nr:PE domain-containing protein [Mycobacterium sp. TY814]MDP7721312.1 PE domain-containing protein [Mycobacterium sp. TY814]